MFDIGDKVVYPHHGAAVVERRETKEAATRQRLEAGELGLDLYGMRDALAKAGLKYVDDEQWAANQEGPRK